MDVLRERECKDSIERQLAEERKLRGKLSICWICVVNAERAHVPNWNVHKWSVRQLASLLSVYIVCQNWFIRISKYCISISTFNRIRIFLFRFIASRTHTHRQCADLNIGRRISRRRKLDSLTVKSDNSIFSVVLRIIGVKFRIYYYYSTLL